nr:hypothetical protein [Xenorhabdus bovienii]
MPDLPTPDFTMVQILFPFRFLKTALDFPTTSRNPNQSIEAAFFSQGIHHIVRLFLPYTLKME